MSYTSITTTRPGPRMQAAETSEEGDALLAELFGILAANGGESVLAGQDFARGVSVAITKYEDSAAAVKTQRETASVRWSVADESGVEEVTWGSGYATVYRIHCHFLGGGAWSIEQWGSLESGSATNGVFVADWTLDEGDAVESQTGTGVCSAHFMAIDKWGNYTRTNVLDVITVNLTD